MLLNAYSRELKRRRLAAGAQGLVLTDTGLTISIHLLLSLTCFPDGDQHIDEDTSSEEEFHYPFAMAEDRRSLSRMSIQTDHSRPGVSRGPTDLTPQLSQAPEFRVPTREAPQKVITPHWTLPTPQTLTTQWERDDQVNQCRDCQRKFTFLIRRVCLNFYYFGGCAILMIVSLARKYFFSIWQEVRELKATLALP